MAITLTLPELRAALRLGDSVAENAEAQRLLTYATETITRHLGNSFTDTPDAIVNEAAVRVAGYLYDRPLAPRGAGYGNALRNSGAASALLPWRVHRAGAVKSST